MTRSGARQAQSPRVPAPRLPVVFDDGVRRMLATVPESAAVELKVTVPDSDRRPVMAALGVDPLDAEIRQVAFVDTPDLAVLGAGVVVRVRRTQHGAGDLVVKVRSIGPDAFPDELGGQHGLGVEVDVSQTRLGCAATLRTELSDRRAKELLSSRLTIADVASAAQQALLSERVADQLARDDLAVHGPIHVLKRKFLPSGLEHRLVAELWFLPDGSRTFELSTTCTPSGALQVAGEIKQFLARHGVDLDARKDSRARSALTALVAGSERP